jgi:5-methylcytosine-specific restriction endonuclease McrBC GTP-binding regulatory subunit McrB
MEYFKLKDKQHFLDNVEKQYDTKNLGTIWFLDTRHKLQHLITLIEAKLNLSLINNYNEKPNGMAGQGKGFKLKHYILAGFIEKKYFKKIGKKCFLKVQFYEQNGEMFFSTDIDVNFSDGKNKFNRDRDNLQNNSSHSWKVDVNFPKDWDALINLILPVVSKNISFLDNYITNQILPAMETTSIENNSPDLPNSISLNQILYGPPGTGKTFNTIDKALAIIGVDTIGETRADIKNIFEQKVNEKQIVFTTFHQSMSYEDFIEGIKPHTKNENVTYAIEDGIFKIVVKKALIEYIRKDTDVDEATEFDTLYNDFVNSIKPLEGKRQGTFTTKTGVEIMLVEANDASISVKYVWSNNTKKEAEGQHVFSVTKEKLKKVLLEGIEPSKIKNLKAELHPLIGHIHCELFAVYKNFYEFVIANKGEIETIHFDYEELSFEEVKEQFDVLTKEEIKAKKVKPYVIIIDEINRGNVSQIFGELITLIEEDKRLGEDEALEVMLPYSKEKFGVPPNLYIVGTMNTADRSVEALDTALRRRFSFEEIQPNSRLIATEGKLKESQGIVDDINLPRVLETINNRIEILSNRDHKIGHSYFMKVTSLADLKATFKKNIIPLLQEYFYNDHEKIGWVLGEGFFVPQKADKKTIFTDFFKQQKPDFEVTYQLADIDTIEIKKAMLQLLGDFKEEQKAQDIEN